MIMLHNTYVYEGPNLKPKPATTLDLYLDQCLKPLQIATANYCICIHQKKKENIIIGLYIWSAVI